MKRSKQQKSINLTQKLILNNSKKSTYLTTYQQFLSNQIRPYQLTHNTLEEKDQQMNENTVLLENRTTQKLHLQTPQMKSIEREPTNNKRKLERNGTRRKTIETDVNSSAKDQKTLQQLKRSRKHESTHNVSEKLSKPVSNNSDSLSYQEPPVVLEDEPVTAYECKICSFETIYEDVFKEHVRTHKKKETFHKCPKCTFKVKCRASIKKHMVVDDKHNGEVMYCGLYSYCDKCKGDLDLHLTMHEEDQGRHLSLDHSYTAK